MPSARALAGRAERLGGGEVLVHRGEAFDGNALVEQLLVHGGAVFVAAEARLGVALFRVYLPASAAQEILAFVVDEADDCLLYTSRCV